MPAEAGIPLYAAWQASLSADDHDHPRSPTARTQHFLPRTNNLPDSATQGNGPSFVPETRMA